MSKAVLYSNRDVSVAIVDIPTSIAEAQRSVRQLASTRPVDKPWVTPEPKDKKREELRAAIPPEEIEYHSSLASILQAYLEDIRGQSPAPKWCLDRYIPTNELAVLTTDSFNTSHIQQQHSPPLILSTQLNRVGQFRCLTNTVVCNPHPDTGKVETLDHGNFLVPPRSVFLSSTIREGLSSFSKAVHCLAPQSHHDKFDLILLDPPWGNRSARHSGVYKTTENQSSDPFCEVLPVIRDHLSSTGYVGVWITNKATVRSQVTEALGEFGLVLFEEWIWLKVTAQGEPVTPLNGLWRKPYEIMLLFCKKSLVAEVGRRVGIAVPDIHSRKPNLKFMFEQYLPENYLALELFARSLTAGWWSWGDEVLKFQREGCWTNPDADEDVGESG